MSHQQRLEIGPLIRLLFEANVDKVLELAGEYFVLQLRRRFVNNIIEKLKYCHYFWLQHRWIAIVGIICEYSLQRGAVRRWYWIHADCHLNQRKAKRPNVRLNRIMRALKSFRLKKQIQRSICKSFIYL